MESHGSAGAVGGVEETPQIIAGNVDSTTGNVDARGALVIQGDVLSGFSVRTRGPLEVLGTIEDATLDVDGDLVVRHGFTGCGKGKITASGTVTLSHVRNQTVVAGKDVIVGSECINATIHAGGRISAPRAVVSGGKLDAMTEIEVGELGLADDISAKIRVGQRGKLVEHLGTVDKDLGNAERQLREVKEAVYKLVKIKVDGGTLTADKEALLVKLRVAQKLLPERIAAINAEHSTLQAELQKKSDARVVVHGTVHAKTMIEVNGARKILDGAIRSVAFVEWGGTLEARSL
jgi:uncharacterized protein